MCVLYILKLVHSPPPPQTRTHKHTHTHTHKHKHTQTHTNTHTHTHNKGAGNVAEGQAQIARGIHLPPPPESVASPQPNC